MNQEQASTILTVLNRAGLVWAMEGQTAVWAMGLEDVSFETAQEVVTDFVRNRRSTERSVTPGDVRAEVERIRAARFADWERAEGLLPEPPCDPDDVAKTIAFQRAFRRAIGDGLDSDRADEAACRAIGTTRRPEIGQQIDVSGLIARTRSAIRKPPVRDDAARTPERARTLDALLAEAKKGAPDSSAAEVDDPADA